MRTSGRTLAFAAALLALLPGKCATIVACAPATPPRSAITSCNIPCDAPYDPTPLGPDDTGECYCEAPATAPQCAADAFVGIPCGR